MKTHIFTLTLLLGLISGSYAADAAAKPSVSMTVKRQLLDTERNKGALSESSDKEITLRVEIKNITNENLEGAELIGEAMLNRAINEKERMVIEHLKSMKLPTMKPNEKITVDLGKIVLNKVRWKSRTFEETLEEWKVVCKKGDAKIGENLSDPKYPELVKEMEKQKEKDQEKIDQEVIRARDKDDPRNIRRRLRN